MNILDAFWSSTIIYFITYYSYLHQSYIDTLSLGFSLVFSLMVTSLLQILLQATRIDWSVVGSMLLSFIVYLAFTLIFDAVCVSCIPYESPYRVSFHTFRQGRFWFTNLFIVVIALLPRFIVKGLYNTFVNPLNRDFSKTINLYL